MKEDLRYEEVDNDYPDHVFTIKVELESTTPIIAHSFYRNWGPMMWEAREYYKRVVSKESKSFDRKYEARCREIESSVK